MSLLSSAPQLFVGRRDFPAETLQEVIAWLKANPAAHRWRCRATSATAVISPAFVAETDRHFVSVLQFTLWRGLWAPAGTPKDVIAKLNAAVVDSLLDPQVRKQLADIGNEAYPKEQLAPEALRAHQTAEMDKWWPIIKAANIKPECR